MEIMVHYRPSVRKLVNTNTLCYILKPNEPILLQMAQVARYTGQGHETTNFSVSRSKVKITRDQRQIRRPGRGIIIISSYFSLLFVFYFSVFSAYVANKRLHYRPHSLRRQRCLRQGRFLVLFRVQTFTKHHIMHVPGTATEDIRPGRKTRPQRVSATDYR